MSGMGIDPYGPPAAAPAAAAPAANHTPPMERANAIFHENVKDNAVGYGHGGN